MCKKLFKNGSALVLVLLLMVQFLPVSANAAAQTPAVSCNINRQDYTRWSEPVTSYLYTRADGGLTRVEYISGAYGEVGKVVVEDYDDGFHLVNSRTIAPELPLWGGFFAGEKANFLIFGQMNPEELDSAEVIRVVKYSKNWVRQGQASLCGANTFCPFEAGSLRCDACGDYLYIRTCHKMYETKDDSLRHQANLTFCVDTQSMTVTDSYDQIMNVSVGYVSHSFNQFLIVDQNNKLVTLDHGDGYPRGVVFMKYYADAATGKFTGTYEYEQTCSYGLMKEFAGDIGNNYTGASVGGLAETEQAYIMAYNDNGTGAGTDNRIPHYHWMDKATGKSRAANINNAQSSATPVLAPTGMDGGYMLWNDKSGYTISKKMHYLSYGADGTPGAIQDAEAPLSDCQPIPYKGGAIWYVTDNSIPTFYMIDRRGVTAHAVGSGSVTPAPKPKPAGQPKLSDPRTLPTLPEAVEMADRLVHRADVFKGLFIDKNGDLWEIPYPHTEKEPRFRMHNVVQVAVPQNGGDAFCALKDNGEIWVYGHIGALGLGGSYEAESDVPQLLNPADNVGYRYLVDDGYILYAIDNNDTLWELYADMDYVNHTYFRPGKDRIMENVKQVSCGAARGATLTHDGSVYFWGCDGIGCAQNDIEWIGDEPLPYTNRILTPDKRIISVGMDYENGWAIDEDGGLWCWGCDEFGQIGNDGKYDVIFHHPGHTDYDTPGRIEPVKVIERDVISAWPGMAVLRDGSVLRWGGLPEYKHIKEYSTHPVRTGEQAMLAGYFDVTREGDLVDRSAYHWDYLSFPNFIPAQTDLTPSDKSTTLISADYREGYLYLNADPVPGETLEYCVTAAGTTPETAEEIRWQAKNYFLLEPGTYSFHVRVRSKFGTEAHGPGPVSSRDFEVPQEIYLRAGTYDAKLYAPQGFTEEKRASWTCFLAGYDENGRLLHSEFDEVRTSGDILAWFSLENWPKVDHFSAFLVTKDGFVPITAACGLTMHP